MGTLESILGSPILRNTMYLQGGMLAQEIGCDVMPLLDIQTMPDPGPQLGFTCLYKGI